GVSELQLPCFTAVRAEIALMSGSAFAVTHHAFSSGAGRTADRNRSHWSTSKTPSYTKSVSWQHHLITQVPSSVDAPRKPDIVGIATLEIVESNICINVANDNAIVTHHNVPPVNGAGVD